MTWLTFLPAAVTTTLGIALGRLALPLHPAWSARLIVTIAVTTMLATVGTFVFIAINYLASLAPTAAGRLPEWALIGDDASISAWLGWPAIALTCVSVITAGRLSARWLKEIRSAGATSAELVRTDVPVALAIPGRRGGVVVSHGLLRNLSPAQRQVVFHHEGSHLRHRHHRYLALSALGAGLLPPLRPLNQRLRFLIERWADEDVAEVVDDRALVAHTLARVALAQPDAGTALSLGFSDSWVVPRVQALLGAPPNKNAIMGPVSLAAGGITTGLLALTALQIDDALRFLLP